MSTVVIYADKTQLEQIDIARRIIAHYPDKLQFATSVADIRAAHRAGRIPKRLYAQASTPEEGRAEF